MTRSELNTSIDTIFDDNRPDDSLTPSMEGTELKKVADYAEGLHNFIEKTKAEIDTLIVNSLLIPGRSYKITGVNPTLYDDGTTSGTTIYLQAITANKLESQGNGIFYNPKYNKAVDGFGIWNPYMYGTMSDTVGFFDYLNKEQVTANNGAVGFLYADGMIKYLSGDWAAATSITGQASLATANVSGFISVSYPVETKVIWGGYSWTNTTGNVGTSIDVLNLDPADWSKDEYDEVNYNKVLDLIEYDIENDWISRRYEVKSGNNVIYTFTDNNYNGFDNSAISVFMFGNEYDADLYIGIGNNSVNHAYNENINFMGKVQNFLNFETNSYQIETLFSKGCKQEHLSFGKNTSQTNLIFGQDTYQDSLIFEGGTVQTQTNIIFGKNSYQSNLIFSQGSYQTNIIFGENSYQLDLILGQIAYQENITFGFNSHQYAINLCQASDQSNITFGQNSLQEELVFKMSSVQEGLVLGVNAIQSALTFEVACGQIDVILGQDSQQLMLTFMKGSTCNNYTVPSGLVFQNTTFDVKTNLNGIDFSLATLVYEDFPKIIYKKPDGTNKLRYYDNNDLLVIADITD